MSVMNTDIEKNTLSEAFTYLHNFMICTVVNVYSFCGWSGQIVADIAVISGLTYIVQCTDKVKGSILLCKDPFVSFTCLFK